MPTAAFSDGGRGHQLAGLSLVLVLVLALGFALTSPRKTRQIILRIMRELMGQLQTKSMEISRASAALRLWYPSSGVFRLKPRRISMMKTSKKATLVVPQ